MSSKSGVFLVLGIFFFCIVDVRSVLGNYEINNNNNTDFGEYPPTYAEGRQFMESPRYSGVNFNNFKPVVTTRSKPRPLVRSGRIKMRMVENSPDADDQLLYEDKPYPQQYSSVPYMYGQGNTYGMNQYMAQGYDSYMHDIEAKEAALKGFGIGLAIGLGALGSLSGLLKFLLIPLLALGALLPLLLLLTAPIPVISMGKMFLGSVNGKQAGISQTRLRNVIEDIMKKLPDLNTSPPSAKKA